MKPLKEYSTISQMAKLNSWLVTYNYQKSLEYQNTGQISIRLVFWISRHIIKHLDEDPPGQNNEEVMVTARSIVQPAR